MLFQTTQEHEELRAKIRAFAEAEIKPVSLELDQTNTFPDEIVRKLGENGWMGIPYPKEYGGAGLDVISYAIAVEELSRVDGGVGVILSAHTSLGTYRSRPSARKSRNANTWFLFVREKSLAHSDLPKKTRDRTQAAPKRQRLTRATITC